jgi:hypothetical protein
MIRPSCASIALDFVDQGFEPVVRLGCIDPIFTTKVNGQGYTT